MTIIVATQTTKVDTQKVIILCVIVSIDPVHVIRHNYITDNCGSRCWLECVDCIYAIDLQMLDL